MTRQLLESPDSKETFGMKRLLVAAGFGVALIGYASGRGTADDVEGS